MHALWRALKDKEQLLSGVIVGAVGGWVISTVPSESSFLCWIEGHPGLASWMQAFVTVAGIYAAWRGLAHQHRLQIKNEYEVRAEEKISAIEGVQELVGMLHTDLLKIARFLGGGNGREWMPMDDRIPQWQSDYAARTHALGAVPIYQYPYSAIASGMARYQVAADQFLRDVEAHHKNEKGIRQTVPETRMYLSTEEFSIVAKEFERFKSVCFEQAELIRRRAGM